MAKKKDTEQTTPESDMPTQEDVVAVKDEVTAETEVEEPVTGENGKEPSPSPEEVTGEGEAEVTSQLEALKQELALVREESAKNLENWQRTAAEFANFKRRQEEQMKLQRDRIKSEMLQGVISALDDLDLAFQNLPAEIDGQLIGWVEGFRLVQRKLNKILDEQNVLVIQTEGQFDPNFHEAVSYEDSDDYDTDQIIAELRKGYQIGSRVIRPALVRVAK